MSHPLFDKHRATLDGALSAIRARGFWSPYPEIPKAYGETAMADGKAAFDAHLNRRFELGQAGEKTWVATEKSPYGVDLGISYPVSDAGALLDAGTAAMPAWRKLGAEGRVGICLEILDRINKCSFEMSHAVMLTSGQGWAMAFQAGGPHAQDRGLEAVAYGWQEMSQVPAEATWEKPQGKNPPLMMRKHFEIVGRGVSLVIGCSTFPTWNSYPGLFAALATGNAVIVKPHPNAILPVAITVRIVRDVLQENGVPPDLVTLCVDPDPAITQRLATHPAVKSVDYTGGNAFGSWLLENCKQAQVYAEMAGVNNVVIDSTDNYKGLLKNLAFTLSLYSGQMCTTTQVLIVPSDGIGTPEGRIPFDQVAADLGGAIDRFLSDPAVAAAVLGAINSEATLKRIEEAPTWGDVVLTSRKIEHPDFPKAQVRSPVLLKTDAANEKGYMEERFGPISFVVKAKNAGDALALSERIVQQKGALTVGLYSTSKDVIDAMTEAALRAGVALSLNLTSGVYVNQSAGFSDYHGTGANPAANSSYTDSAFVANRFRVVQRRYHV